MNIVAHQVPEHVMAQNRHLRHVSKVKVFLAYFRFIIEQAFTSAHYWFNTAVLRNWSAPKYVGSDTGNSKYTS